MKIENRGLRIGSATRSFQDVHKFLTGIDRSSILQSLSSAAPLLALAALPLASIIQVLHDGTLLSGSDIALQFYPFRQFAYDSLRHGHLPQWNPYLFAGAPLAGNVQMAVFYPLNLLFLLLPTDWALTITMLLHLLLAGLFMRWWMRSLDVSEWSSTLSGIIFQFSGFQTARLAAGHVSLTMAAAWIPLIFFLGQETFRRRDSRWALATGAALAVQFMAGHPGISFITALGTAALCLYTISTKNADTKTTNDVKDKKSESESTSLLQHIGVLRSFKSLASSVAQVSDLAMLIALTALALAAVQLLPTLGVLKESTRSAGTSYDFATGFSLPPENLLTLFAPGFFGDGQSVPYWGRWYGWEAMGYVGVLPLILAIVAVIVTRNRMTRFFAIIAITSLLLSLGRYLPGFRVLYEHVPGFSFFRAPARMLVLWTVAVSALAGMGLDAVRNVNCDRPWLRTFARWLCWLAAISVLVVAVASYNEDGGSIFWKLVTGYFLALGTPQERLTHLHRFNPSFLLDSFRVAQESCIAFVVVLSCAAAWLTIWVHSKSCATNDDKATATRFSHPAATTSPWLAAAIILIAADLWYYGNRHIKGTDRKSLGWEPHVTAFLRSEGSFGQQQQTESDRVRGNLGTFRVANLSRQGGENVGMMHNIEMAGGYDPLIPSRFAEYANFSERRPIDEPVIVATFDRSFGKRAHQTRLTDLLGIRYVVVDKKSGFDDARLGLVKATDQTAIYESQTAFPRAWVVQEWKVMGGKSGGGSVGQAILHELAHGTTDLRKVALLEEEPSFAKLATQPASNKVSAKAETADCRIVRYRPEQVTVAVSSPARGLLMLADAFAPGWQALVDGKPASILRANHLFRAVPISAGRHRVEFRYKTPNLLLGGTISALAWLGLIGYGIRSYRRPR